MTTKLNKPVRRVSSELKRDRSKFRPVVVSIYPAGFIGLRLQGCRKEETISISAAYDIAIKSRVLREREEKRKAKGGKYLATRGKL